MFFGLTDDGYLFPAYAGVILDEVDLVKTIVTFPRVCGGDPQDSSTISALIDFSPRMRG